MRLSQLTRRMDRGDEIRVCLSATPVDRMEIYCGAVRGIKKENPINGMFVSHVCACDECIVVEVQERKKGGQSPGAD